MSWLSSFWDHNRNFLGNALKNVAPAAFLIPGVGPLAAAGIGGLGSALGQGIRKGANIGDIVKQGITGASEAYGGAKLTGGQGDSLSRLKSIFTGGGNQSPASAAVREAGRVPSAYTPSSSLTLPPTGGVSGAAGAGGLPGVQYTPGALSVDATPTAARLAANGVPGAGQSLLRQIGSFVHDNPMAAGMGLQGAGQLAQLPAENRLKRSQQAQIDYETEREKARDAALAPLWELINAQMRTKFS